MGTETTAKDANDALLMGLDFRALLETAAPVPHKQIVSFNDWKRLDDVEVARGERRGAPRDKIVDVETMLEVLAPR